jgi:hypothetical protein
MGLTNNYDNLTKKYDNNKLNYYLYKKI